MRLAAGKSSAVLGVLLGAAVLCSFPVQAQQPTPQAVQEQEQMPEQQTADQQQTFKQRHEDRLARESARGRHPPGPEREAGRHDARRTALKALSRQQRVELQDYENTIGDCFREAIAAHTLPNAPPPAPSDFQVNNDIIQTVTTCMSGKDVKDPMNIMGMSEAGVAASPQLPDAVSSLQASGAAALPQQAGSPATENGGGPAEAPAGAVSAPATDDSPKIYLTPSTGNPGRRNDSGPKPLWLPQSQ